ncbi:MAG: endonuclease V [Acidobacteriota bacterium]
MEEFIIPKSYKDAIEVQEKLAPRVKIVKFKRKIEHVGGADVSYSKHNKSIGIIAILNLDTLKMVEFKTSTQPISFPYIPGLLSFREIPCLLNAFKKLHILPDLLIVDGNGIAHPRKIGIASHMGILLNIPTIGCAKKPFYPTEIPENYIGAFKYMKNKKEEIVGVSLRTRENVKPVYISPGHLINFEESIEIILKVSRFRIPEPLRFAHTIGKNLNL